MNESSNVFWAAFGGAAAAGLVTLVGVLAAEWYRWFLDRPLIKVEARLGYILYPFGDPDKTQYFFIEAMNPHSKPVILSQFGCMFKHKKWGWIQQMPVAGYKFPYKLDGECSLSQWTPVDTLFDVLKEMGRKPSDLKWVVYRTASGKHFRGKIKKSTIKALEKSSHQTNESKSSKITKKRD